MCTEHDYFSAPIHVLHNVVVAVEHPRNHASKWSFAGSCDAAVELSVSAEPQAIVLGEQAEYLLDGGIPHLYADGVPLTFQARLGQGCSWDEGKQPAN